MKNVKQFIGCLLLLLPIFVACSEKDEIKGNITLVPPYHLPNQGESEDGDKVIDFFENYSCFLLYDFTESDFRIETADRYTSYQCVPGNVAYLGAMLDYLNQTWFGFYPETFKLSFLPFKIFLVDDLMNVPDFEDEDPESYKVLLGKNSIAVAGMNSRLPNLSSEEKLYGKCFINKVFAEFLLGRSVLSVPEEFYNVSDYSKFYTSKEIRESGNPDLLRELGYLPLCDNEEWGGTPAEWAQSATAMKNARNSDLKSFLQNMIMHGDDFNLVNNERFTWNYYLQMDGTAYKWPLVQRKMEILRTYFIEKYGIDWMKIGNARY